MSKLRVLALMHEDFLPPDSLDGLSEKEVYVLKTEYDVVTALEHLGHEAQSLGVTDDLEMIRSALAEFKPHVVFNLLEEFRGEGSEVPFVLGYLRLLRQRFTGCNPAGLLLADHKPAMKKILKYHDIPMPSFTVFEIGQSVCRPEGLDFPLIVKSATEHGSIGIAQASVVHSDNKLIDRVAYMHEQFGTDAIVEEYIDGRELYVGVIGNGRLQTLPIWEMRFTSPVAGSAQIATERVKWDVKHQAKLGLKNGLAEDLNPDLVAHMNQVCKRVYRILGLSGYARMDFRLTPEGKAYLLEPNPNPDLAHDDDFAKAAEVAGIEYEPLIQKVLNLARSHPSATST